MALRVRVPELLNARRMTPYRLAKASGRRISLSAAYRLVRLGGRIERVSAPLIEALCDVLEVGLGKLFERVPEPVARRRRGK